jgi:imidazoleglycerol-phosphate dehydratase
MKHCIRETKETRIEITIDRASRGATSNEINVSTSLPFFDHMIHTLARYAGLSLELTTRGDLTHHIMEDTAIALGRAVRGIAPIAAARFGERTIPMDDALVSAYLDVGGRFYFEGELPNRLHTHVFRSFADALGATLHLVIIRGTDRHHIIEAAYKATGLALKQSLAETGDVFSTKGTVHWEEHDGAPPPKKRRNR